MPLRIGAPSFYNTLPFFYPILQKKIDADVECIFEVPTRINELLTSGELDVGLVSSIHAQPPFHALPTIGIGASQEVMSVNLYANNEVVCSDESIIGITTASKTSQALLKVLCYHALEIHPTFVPFDPKETSLDTLKDLDGFLLIGDACLEHPTIAGFTTIDLATAWYTNTDLPFIFALFASPEQKHLEFVEPLLQHCLDWSMEHIDEVIASVHSKVPPEMLARYFRTLEYRLTPQHFQGLHLFQELIKTYDIQTS